jgi:hypothetical protein
MKINISECIDLSINDLFKTDQIYVYILSNNNFMINSKK